MKNIAIITARCGSKGVKDKNIKILCGKPLIWYTIRAAVESKMFDEVMVSTDSEKYADIAVECGACVPFLRSLSNAGDKASSWDVVREVIDKYYERGESYDTVALLQPTSPLRNSQHIREGYQLMKEKKANAVVAVTAEEHSPLWSNTLPRDRNMRGFIRPEVLGRPRQELEEYYRINGALYILRTNILNNIQNLYEEGCFAYIMDSKASIDIDTDFDFLLAELLLRLNMDERTNTEAGYLEKFL